MTATDVLHRDQLVKLDNILVRLGDPGRAFKFLRSGEARGDYDQVVATLNDCDPHWTSLSCAKKSSTLDRLGIGMMSAYAVQIALLAFFVLGRILSPVCLARRARGRRALLSGPRT